MANLTRQELLEKRGDLSQFLIHLTRTGDLKLDKDIYSLSQDNEVFLGQANFKFQMHLFDIIQDLAV